MGHYSYILKNGSCHEIPDKSLQVAVYFTLEWSCRNPLAALKHSYLRNNERYDVSNGTDSYLPFSEVTPIDTHI